MISDGELGHMRTVSQSILTQTCKIERPTEANDGQGGVTTTWAVVNYNVPCRVAVTEVKSQQVARQNRVTSYSEYTLKLKHDADIAENDRVTVDSLVYRIESIADDHQWVMVKRCYMTRVF